MEFKSHICLPKATMSLFTIITHHKTVFLSLQKIDAGINNTTSTN